MHEMVLFLKMVAINKTQPLCIEQPCKCCSPYNEFCTPWYSLPVGVKIEKKREEYMYAKY